MSARALIAELAAIDAEAARFAELEAADRDARVALEVERVVPSAATQVAVAVGAAALLLLDDVFSELDEHRAHALLSLLVADQTFVTTAAPSPPVDGPIQHLRVEAGTVTPA